MLAWLLFSNGADTIYRRVRRFLHGKLGHLGEPFGDLEAKADRTELERLRNDTAELVAAGLERAERSVRERSRDPGIDGWIEISKAEGRADVEGFVGTGPTMSVACELHAVSRFILDDEGARMLRETERSPSRRALIIERASARVSFQPRFVYVRLVGVVGGPEAELPAMDRSGYADAYVVCRIASADGTSYPAHGVLSSTRYRTLRPRWAETLELALRGGTTGADGVYRAASDVADANLLFEVYDADVGLWGWLLHTAELAAVALAAAMAVAYATALWDRLSPSQAPPSPPIIS